MKSVVRGLGLGAALVAVVGASSAFAQGGHYNTTVLKPNVRVHPSNPNGGRLIVAARIISPKRGCEVGRKVSLYQEHGTIDIKMDSDYTDPGGRAEFDTYGPQAFYYVRAEKKKGGGYFCPSRRSPVASAF